MIANNANKQLLAIWEALDGGSKPRCRDCADHHGRCPSDNLPCDPQERALEQITNLGRRIATTKPAPDAVREALAAKIEKAWRWNHVTSNGGFIESLNTNEQALIVAALRAAPIPLPEDVGEPVWPPYVELPLTFWYKNHRGEESLRTVFPVSIRFGSTEWHPEAQWLLKAFDHDKQAEREFAMREMVAAPPVRGDRETLVPPVERLEMVDYSAGYKQDADPMWRVQVSGYCTDFYTETAASNFRNAILSLPGQPGAGERETMEECRSIFEGVKNVLEFAIGLAWDAERLIPDSEPKRLRGILNNIRQGYLKPAVERLNALTRQPPQPTSEGEAHAPQASAEVGS